MRIGIRATLAGFIQQLAPFLPPRWEPFEPSRKLDTLYSWIVGGERNGLRKFDIMYGGSAQVTRTLDRGRLFEEFESSLRMTVAVLSRRFAFIHAGVVGWHGRAILLPGRAGWGKSTMVQALLRAGAEYFSDEYAVLDTKGQVHPFLKPISIKRSPPLHNALLPVEAIGGCKAERPMKVGTILITRYRKGAKSVFRSVSSGRGTLGLIGNAFAARRAPARVLRATRSASANAIVLSGVRGEAQQAARPLLRMVDAWLIAEKRLHLEVPHAITEVLAMATQGHEA